MRRKGKITALVCSFLVTITQIMPMIGEFIPNSPLLGKVYAADSGIIKDRGTVVLNLADFSVISSTDWDKSGFKKDGSDPVYNLYYDKINPFDRTNTGITVRSNNTFSLVGVTGITVYANTKTDDSGNKLFIYADESSGVTWPVLHRDEDDYDSRIDKLKSNHLGNYYGLASFAAKISRNVYSNDFQTRTVSIDSKLKSAYIYLALSHTDGVGRPEIRLDNESTFDTGLSGQKGHLTMNLRKFKVKYKDPEKVNIIDKNGNDLKIDPVVNDYIVFADGATSYGDAKPAYRDESIYYEYSLNDSEAASPKMELVGFNILNDSGNVIIPYTDEVIAFGNIDNCEIKLTSDLIQKIEDKNGNKDSFTIQPVFMAEKIEMNVLPYAGESYNGNDYDVTVKTTSQGDGYRYALIDKQAGNQTICEITQSVNGHVGDHVFFDIVRNPSYTGQYVFFNMEVRNCETEKTVAGTFPKMYMLDGTNPANVSMRYPYCYLAFHLAKDLDISLSDKTVYYSGRKITADAAQISYDGKPISTEKEIEYHYYSDSACTDEITDDIINAGVYYMRAYYPGDNDFAPKYSNVAVLTVKKAIPDTSKVRAADIVFGQKVSASSLSGKVTGVDGNTITGTLSWTAADADVYPEKAGNTKQYKAHFVPGSIYANNYEEATFVVPLKIKKATPTIELPSGITAEYGGTAPKLEDAVVTGVDRPELSKPTGKITYNWYKDSLCLPVSQIPATGEVVPGTYYVKAEVASDNNYSKAVSNAVKVTVEKKHAKIDFMIDYNSNKLVGVVSGIVDDYPPTGKIAIALLNTDDTQYNVIHDIELTSDDDGTCSFILNDINTNLTKNLKVVALYLPDGIHDISQAGSDDKYIIPQETLVHNNDKKPTSFHSDAADIIRQYGDSPEQVELHPSYMDEISGDTETPFKFYVPGSAKAFSLSQSTLQGNFYVANGPAATINFTNAGTGVFGAKVDEGADYGEAYYFYYVKVKPAIPQIVLTNTSEVYDGNPHTIETNLTGVSGGTPVTGDVEYTVNGSLGSQAVIPGEYTVVGKVLPKGNYADATSAPAKLTILKATPKITLKDFIQIYTGQAYTPEVSITAPVDYDAAGVVLPKKEDIVFYFTENGTDWNEGLPVYPGQYKVKAVYPENGYYNSCEEICEAIINKANVRLTVTDKEEKYTGDAITVDTASVDSEYTNTEEILSKVKYYYIDSLNTSKLMESAPVEPGIYYAFAYSKEEPLTKRAISNRAVITITKRKATVKIKPQEKVYDGKTFKEPEIRIMDGDKDITGLLSDDIKSAYFVAAGLIGRIEAPVNAGEYYIGARLEESGHYLTSYGYAEAKILKAEPDISGFTAGKIQVGDKVGKSEISGTATGAEGEELTGDVFYKNPGEIAEAGGILSAEFYFAPTGEYALNYKPAEGMLLVEAEPKSGDPDAGNGGITAALLLLAVSAVTIGIIIRRKIIIGEK